MCSKAHLLHRSDYLACGTYFEKSLTGKQDQRYAVRRRSPCRCATLEAGVPRNCSCSVISYYSVRNTVRVYTRCYRPAFHKCICELLLCVSAAGNGERDVTSKSWSRMS